MKVKPLFRNGKPPEPEDLMRYLDLPDEHEEKRAFLNACVTGPQLAQAWEETQRLASLGNTLPEYNPPGRIRSQVLELAKAEQQAAMLPTNEPKSTTLQKLAVSFAWAASIFLLSYSVYIQSQSAEDATINNTSQEIAVSDDTLETLNSELLTLEEDLLSLQTSMGVETVEMSEQTQSSNT